MVSMHYLSAETSLGDSMELICLPLVINYWLLAPEPVGVVQSSHYHHFVNYQKVTL